MTLEHIEKRICDKGLSTIDICHLYVYYHNYVLADEVIQIDALYYKEDNEIEQYKIDDYGDYENDEDEYDEYDDLPYVSGYAEKQSDGSILIVFGESLEDKNS